MVSILQAHQSPVSPYKLHVGVMLSRKTLLGLPSDWSNVYPPKERVGEFFYRDNTYNCLHYADRDPDPDFETNLSLALSYGGKQMHAVQLDLVWPDPETIRRVLDWYGRPIDVILQINEPALRKCCYSPQQVMQHLETYLTHNAVHRILLDASGGTGLPLDAAMLTTFGQAIQRQLPQLGIGVAGGLGPTSLYLLEPLLGTIKNLSIDAQSKLRSSGNAKGPINLDLAASYIKKALEVLSASYITT